MITASEILESLLREKPKLSACGGAIDAAARLLVNCFRSGGKLLICGNGGSAADGDHISAELLKSFRRKRPLEISAKAPPWAAEKLQGALPAVPLANFSAFMTAFSNDCDPEYAFAQLVFALGKEHDVLLSISTSGNSPNVLRACETAKAMKLKVVGLGGSDGGKMLNLCDPCICAPENETHLIQELHLPIYHGLCAMVEADIFSA
ncbi:MAG: SIS domain-containing protein [Puniceicoccales bacterium]|nr:SIS domain-containing protein [Puniceicoccales bacterium]